MPGRAPLALRELRYSLGIDPAIGKRRSASRLCVVAVRTL
jgi:hypothetical protein